jgi:hypothetical protein
MVFMTMSKIIIKPVSLRNNGKGALDYYKIKEEKI